MPSHDRRIPVVVDTPVLVSRWEPARSARRRLPARAVELSNSLADSRSVARVQRALEHARRKPAPPARKEPTMPRNADLEDEYSRMPVRPPSDEQLRGASRFLAGGLGGGVPQVVDDEPDEFTRSHPFGPGFNARGEQIRTASSPAHDPATLARFEASRATNYTDGAAQEARRRIREQFDVDGNSIPPDRPPMPPTATPGRAGNSRAVQRARQNVAAHLVDEAAPYLRGYRQD